MVLFNQNLVTRKAWFLWRNFGRRYLKCHSRYILRDACQVRRASNASFSVTPWRRLHWFCARKMFFNWGFWSDYKSNGKQIFLKISYSFFIQIESNWRNKRWFFGSILSVNFHIKIYAYLILAQPVLRTLQVRPLTISVRHLLESDAVFAKMGDRINAETVGKVKGVFRFDIVEGKRKVVKSWTADLKNGDGSLVEGEGARVRKLQFYQF